MFRFQLSVLTSSFETLRFDTVFRVFICLPCILLDGDGFCLPLLLDFLDLFGRAMKSV